ncbi:polyprenyl synthetase family protein [Natronoglycomyces albus]|uniref:Polyprenyl synthetase family protein n=1 Tax=Natronoglycomyces albus TaxID=2811108 RepID=A0A895XN55_9ACTN|nr:polyprenyl synthetase family protein [Natronoglycomyces albus]QSB03896.1 polyprenyl synthetase family protein [Natronoglycomyces albus]
MEAAKLTTRVEAELEVFLARQRDIIVQIDPVLQAYADAVADYVLRGGKRMRPTFAYWGYRGAAGVDCPEVVRGVAALELLQAAALIHDDLIDDSDTRRGQPSIHRRFEALHRDKGWYGQAKHFGSSAAILLGDLCFVWSDEMFTSCGMPMDVLIDARGDFDLMRTQVSAGQYLDVLAGARRDTSVDTAVKVAQFKAAKYTVEQPLLIGASLAGAPMELRRHYSRLGLALGEAFQLRDDVLGVYGDPRQTGKPAGDDLREGKYTYLVAKAFANADSDQKQLLESRLGDRELDAGAVENLRGVLIDTGALKATEDRIELLAQEAREALLEARSALTADSVPVFEQLLDAAVQRNG